MKRMMALLTAVAVSAASSAAPTISDLKVTPISPLGLAIDYNVSGATDADSQRELEVSLTVNGTTYQAESLGGTCQGDEFQVTTDCVNGDHRVYWHMGMDFLTLNADNAVLTVRYKGYTSETTTTHDSLYCVVDLLTGTVEYRDDVSPSDLNIDEYKKTKVVLRRIDSGSFIMGEDQTDTSHRVTISEPFYMGMFEVTQAQWTNVYGLNPSNFSGDTKPVECVSYNMIRGSEQGAKWPEANSVDATSFLGKLRAMTKIDFDLPTEAQWEYACRAGTQTTYNLGNGESDLAKAGWYDANSSGTTHSVGSKTPNDWGLYDMHGNVWEWTLDWSGELSYGENPVGASSANYRMLRGGGFGTDVPSEASVWSRENDDYPSCSDAEDYGFRLVMPMQTETTKTTVEAVSATISGVKVSSISNQDDIEGSVVVSTAPTTAKKATFKVDDDVAVLISSTAETYTWKPTTLGEHKLAHECNGYSISSTYNFVKAPEIYSSIAYTNLKGASNTNPTTYLEGMAVSFVNPGEVTGYTFAGWTPSSITADMTGDQTVTANWKANNYTIAYDPDGGSGTMDGTACTYDEDVVIASNEFVRTDYGFLGWATEASGAVVYKAGATVKNLATNQNDVVTLYAVWRCEIPPSVVDDADATVTGDATSGWTVAPSEGVSSVEVTIPDGVDAAKVTVEVGADVAAVTPHGAKVKVVRGGHDITDYLDVPSADVAGSVDLAKATVKEAIQKETLDPEKGAKIELGDPSSPSLTTPATRPGLRYTLREGTTLDGMSDGASKLGDGSPWTPAITVKGGASGFYSIKVTK